MATTAKASNGFTLIELMMVLLIMAVVLAISAPSMESMMERNRIQSSAASFFSHINFARSEALKRNQEVTVCSSSTGTGCTSSNWEAGWLVFADTDEDTVADPNEILLVGGALDNGDTLRVSGSDLSNKLTYRTDGSSSGVGTFVLCNAEGSTNFAREVDISATGRPKINKSTSNCTP